MISRFGGMEGYAVSHSDFERTMIHAEATIAQFKANKTPAYPANYELWYTYSCGFNRALNKAVNDILRKYRRISPTDVQRIYEEHLAPTRLSNRVEEVGSLVGSEVSEISAMLDSALKSAGDYGDTLSTAAKDLDDGIEQKNLAGMIKTLVSATKEMQDNNKQLKSKLHDSMTQIEELQNSIEAIRFQSLTDELTGISNRKCFDQSFSAALEQARESGTFVSLLLCDIDHFKAFNDTHGHQTGDQVLRLVGQTLKSNIKGRDIAARYGGEEFAIILPDTDLNSAVRVAEHIREAVRNKELIKRSTGENLGRVTMSLGVVTNKGSDTTDAMIHRADICLYAAKGDGRDCVKHQDDPELADLSDVA